MGSPNPESSLGAKRKRTPAPEDARAPAIAVHSGNAVTRINYLVRAKSDRLRLIEGDPEIFSDVLSMVDDYEGVLQRHESLAANLGAKLVGPLLLKSFEKLFEGPVKVIQSSFGLEQSPVSWLDIVTFSRTNPADFNLSSSGPGIRSCRFWIKGGQIEISEDDYRLIMSGGPERMIPTQPIAEDESAELGTLNILETRLSMLIKKADVVASKARQLNYHLKGRKTAILGRKATESGEISKEPNFSPQPFSAINARSTTPANGEAAKVQAQLLDQFLTGDNRRHSIPHSRTKFHRISTSDSHSGNFHTFNGHDVSDNGISHPQNSLDEGLEGQYRVLMAAKIEKISKGDPIFPPCDRCRRLKFDCKKHLTACGACTKKHAKCSWRDVTDGELDQASLLQPYHKPPLANGINSIGEHANAEQMDPAIRNPLPGAAMQHRNPAPPHSQIDRDRDGRDDKTSSEHAILTQIASAAAAAGKK